MIKVKFYDIGTIDDNKLLFAVIMAKFRGQWLYVKGYMGNSRRSSGRK